MPASPHNPSKVQAPLAKPAIKAFHVSALTTTRGQGRCSATGWPASSTARKELAPIIRPQPSNIATW
ncbi:MAG: hypothetical protein V9H25_12475 [Candidatus Competibacter sp.]